MTDYLWTFPKTGLAKALDGLTALRIELGLPPGTLPGNALGDPRDARGEVVTPQASEPGKPVTAKVAWIGRPGSAATSFTGPDGKTVAVPAKGDPTKYYMHIRTDKTVQKFDPTKYGLTPTDPVTSANVLGVWSGDKVPVPAH